MCGLWLACAVAVLGHNPETSYAEVKIAADKVETRLTADIFTLVKVAALDDDRDGRLSRAGLTAQPPQINRFLHEHVWLAIGTEDQPADETEDLGELTGFVWPPEVGEVIGEADFHSANGLIHFDFLRKVDQVPADVTLTFGFFREFGDRHTVLANFKYGGRDEEITFDSYE